MEDLKKSVKSVKSNISNPFAENNDSINRSQDQVDNPFGTKI